MSDIRAVILAGGKGSRLLPLTEETPKPLVPVGGRPILHYILKQLKEAGVTRVTLAVNHLAERIEQVAGNGRDYGLEIDYVREQQALSTVGPLTLISDLPDNFLVMNGDILTDVDMARLYDTHLRTKALVTVATYQRKEKIDYGMVECSRENRIIAFNEKPTLDVTVSMGVYVFSHDAIQGIPKGTRYGFDDLMRDLLAAGKVIAAFPHQGYWLDVGRADDYAQAQRDSDIIRKW